MTREEAKHNIVYYMYEDNFKEQRNGFIDNIFDYHEAQLKAKDEEIKRMKALQQPKSCKGCKYLYINKHSEFVEYCSDLNIEIPYSDITTFCCNRYKPKE